MASRYVTPTDRPQWPVKKLAGWAALILTSWVLPFACGFAAVYVLGRMYFAAGGAL
ncbi:hypothetical protein [Rhodococcoides fascians]|uniref:hypothetical protein n=1 Tax=Rhodococcoides fascians TaxID=1828 RepID=UPI0012D36986|nr:hypothetical protein [Rhodococcus fascians]